MFFQEPKVEFIELMLADVTTTSPGGGQGEIGQCDGDTTNIDDCSGGGSWNY